MPLGRGVPASGGGVTAHSALTFAGWVDDGHISSDPTPGYVWTIAGWHENEGNSPYVMLGIQGVDVISYGTDYSDGYIPVLDQGGFIPPGSVASRVVPFLLGATAYPVTPVQYAEVEMLVNGYSIESSVYFASSSACYGRIAVMLASKPTNGVALYLQVSSDNGVTWEYVSTPIELSAPELSVGVLSYGDWTELTGYFQRGAYPIKVRLGTYTEEATLTAFTIVRAWLELQ